MWFDIISAVQFIILFGVRITESLCAQPVVQLYSLSERATMMASSILYEPPAVGGRGEIDIEFVNQRL